MDTLLIPAAERALRLVELLLSRPEGWTPQELLAQLDLSRSSLYLLLRTLKTLGYVEQAGKRGRYSPGPRLKAWRASDSPTPQDLLVAFYQEATAHPLAETLALALPAAARSRDRFLIVAQVEGSSLVRSAFTTGQAYSDLPAAARIVAAEADDELASQGYAFSQQSDAFSLALPVCRDGVHAEAVLLLTAPAFRWTADSLKAAFLEDLRGIAAHLSYRLGAPFYAPLPPD
jgi:DNA-binding IclR family transcriptional regulator